jgi:hypothetical protein
LKYTVVGMSDPNHGSLRVCSLKGVSLRSSFFEVYGVRGIPRRTSG